MKKILIIETAFIGDAILSLALSEELKRHFPASEISMLVRPESAELIGYAPFVTKVFSYDKYGSEKGIRAIEEKANELNSHELDTVFAIHESKRTGALLRHLSAGQKIGFSTAVNLKDSLTVSVPPLFESPKTKKILSLLSFLNVEMDYETLPKLSIPEVLLPKDLRGVDDLVTIAPGSAWETKKWKWEYFAEVAKKLAAEGKTVAIVGGKADSETAQKIVDSTGSEYLKNYAGKLTLSESAAIISHSKLLISNDSSPVHIATATGTKSVVLFGPTVPSFGFAPPPFLGVAVEREGLWCRPCTSHGSRECPTHTHECMTSISPENVYSVVSDILMPA